MAKRRKRSFVIFSLSFLDCICCGFGAVLLLFVLSAGQQREVTVFNDLEIAEAQQILAKELSSLELRIEELKDQIQKKEKDLSTNESLSQVIAGQVQKLEIQSNELNEQLAQLAELREDSADLPDKLPSSVPYLDVFNLSGQKVLFVLEASGGMRGRTIAEVEKTFNGVIAPPYPKWVRAKDILAKLITQLPEKSEASVCFVNTDFESLHPSKRWFLPSNRKELSTVFAMLDKLEPQGAANFELAFREISSMESRPDQIVLLVDGLPTTSTRYSASGKVSAQDRVTFFESAYSALPVGIPIFVVLFPFEEDLDASGYLWALTAYSNGTLITIDY